LCRFAHEFVLSSSWRNGAVFASKHQKGSCDLFRPVLSIKTKRTIQEIRGNQVCPAENFSSNMKNTSVNEKIAESPVHSDARNACSLQALVADAGGLDALPWTGHRPVGWGCGSFWPHFGPILTPFGPILVPVRGTMLGEWRRCSAMGSSPPARTCRTRLPTEPSSQIVRGKQLLCKS